MSLADHLRYLRALAGGTDPDTIAEAIGLDSSAPINLAERRYRPVGGPELVEKLAAYYGRPLEEFLWHNLRARKYLTFYVARALREKSSISLTLRGGQTLSGQPEWWDLGTIGLRDAEGRLLVVQRHAVVDWPNAAERWWLEEE